MTQPAVDLLSILAGVAAAYFAIGGFSKILDVVNASFAAPDVDPCEHFEGEP